MPVGAQLSVPDQRRASRHPADLTVVADHLRGGEITLRVCNVSAHGFMVTGVDNLERGDRLLVPFPIIGRIEAYVMWTSGGRTGLQFERIIRPDMFAKLIDELQPNPKLRRPR